jgi:hypothetical protein
MAGSMLSGWQTFSKLHEMALIGLAIAVAVDVGLCVVLIGDQRLHTLGLSSGWHGRAMRLSTALMSGTLNCGLAIMDGSWFLALLHSFVTLLLVGITEYREAVAAALRPVLLAADQSTATVTPLRVASETVLLGVAPSRAGSVAERAVAKLRELHAAGRDLGDVTHGELAASIGAKVDTCYRNLPRWRELAVAA